MGGPSFQDFIIDKPQHSPHYEYHLHDPEDPKSHRRSIYRFIVRSQQQPFMTVMDCADPSMRVDKRNESLSPLQALAMMNNGLTVAMAKHFAERVSKEAGSKRRRTRLCPRPCPRPEARRTRAARRLRETRRPRKHLPRDFEPERVQLCGLKQDEWLQVWRHVDALEP
jgi:hypothetical protein